MIIRTNSSHLEFVKLVAHLDKELAIRDGDDHDFYHQFNGIDNLKFVVLIKHEESFGGCGAFKAIDENTVEIKRMFTLPAFRGKGLAIKVLTELELWAKELGFKRCRLETGIEQPEAVSLYRKMAYRQIENYGQYARVENSLCFEKLI